MSKFNPNKEEIALLKGDEIELLLESIYLNNLNIKLYVYHIYLKGKFNKIGRITLRLGDSEDIYYFGNIGYNISKKYRGNYFAGKACLILINLLKKYNINENLILTVNPNNIASHKTCEFIGCSLLDTVKVPNGHNLYIFGNHIKCRYVINTKQHK